MEEREATSELSDRDLDQVVGGTTPPGAGDTLVDTGAGVTSDIMKTKHDTVKNSISNVR